MPPLIVPSDESPETISCDALIVGAFSRDETVVLGDEDAAIGDAFNGGLSEYISASGFKAKVGDVLLVPSLGRLGAKAIAVVGLGVKETADATQIRRAAGAAIRQLGERPVLASTLHRAAAGAEGTTAAAEGFLLGSYRFVEFKSNPHPSKVERILFVESADEAAIERALAVSEATYLARDLTNQPPSALTPESLARRAAEIADVAALDCEVWDDDRLVQAGFGGVLAVGRGSANPPRFIQLRYVPPSPRGKVTLLGKGITFDSGGLSLKDAGNMETMKTDMAGAAAVIGAMSALRRLDVQVEVSGFIPAAENMPGPNAIKPGDVIRHYGGKTSEVLNTDAEGRLVLGDALAFASEQHPQAMIDLATLTGGIVIALGDKVFGCFSNDEGLQQELAQAARSSGERMWPMPIAEEYRSDLDSEIADIKNSGSRYGSAIRGALFLREFVGDGIAWAHLDIAGPARADGDYDEVVRGGTGVATRTLLSWIETRGR
jgi:leucyl aminopeptidase